MHKIASYNSHTLAHIHAAHLRSQGIMAGVLGENLANVDPLFAGLFQSGYELYIATQRHADRAQQLIDALGTPELPDNWEHDAVPDLTKLDPNHIPDCPTCGKQLDPSKPLGPCPRCGKKSDLAQLVINAHGPEAMVNCYTHLDPATDLSDDDIRSVPLDCMRCQTPLDDQPTIRGHCPRCSLPFDRRESVAMLLTGGPDAP